MSEHDDEVWLSLTGPAQWEMTVPPVMHPVPAQHLPELEIGERATVAVSIEGGHTMWLVDQYTVASGPTHGPDGATTYALCPTSESGAGLTRPVPEGQTGRGYVYDVRVEVERIWVYRDELSHQDVIDLAPRSDTEWLDRVSDNTAPPVRRPRPARELPTLAGHRVRTPAEGGKGWIWQVAVTEPMDVEGTYRVGVISESKVWEATYGHPPTAPWLFHPPLHTLWTY